MLRLFPAVMLALAVPALAQTGPAPAPATAAAASAAKAEAPAELVSALIEHLLVAETLTEIKRAMTEPHLFGEFGDAKTQNMMSAAWTASANKVLDVESVLATLRSDIAQSFSASDLEWHRSFYQSELGQQFVRLERYRLAETDPPADTAQLMADGLSQAQEIQAELDADPARAKALNRLVAAAGGEEAYIDALLSIATDLAQTAAAAAPAGEAAAKVEALIRGAEQYRPMMSVLVQPMILPLFAKHYEPIATRDIDAYAAQLETPQGKRMTSGLTRLASRTLSRLIVEFGAEFMRQSKSEAAQ